MKHVVFLFVSLLWTLGLNAQYVPTKGEPRLNRDPDFHFTGEEVYSFPAINVDTLLLEDEEDLKRGVPLRFGFPFEVHFDLSHMGTHLTKKGKGTLHLMRLQSQGALSMNLIFSRFNLAPGAEVFVYTPDQRRILGPFSSFHNSPTSELGTLPLPGEEIIIEWFEPESQYGKSRLVVGKVVHGYRDVFKISADFNDSGNCNVNVNCPQGAAWQDQKTSVALLMVGGFRFCSGALINDVPGDGKPYFLTANHCLDPSVGSWVFVFNYESPGCANVNGSLSEAISGCVLRANNADSDFALLELNMPPPASFNAFYSGWSAVNTAGDSSIVIHHPSGDIKKISFDKDLLSSSSGGSGVPNAFWKVGNYEWGTTEGGSSGSPLYNQSGRIVGQLYGGSASCTSITYDDYGKFSFSWNNGSSPAFRLKDWLDPSSTGTTVIDGAFHNNPDTADAGIAWIVTPDVSQCDSVFSPSVRIRNFGNHSLDSLGVACEMDGGVPIIQMVYPGIPWYGNTQVNFPSLTLAPGNHQVKFYTFSPNGFSDQDNSNDTIVRNFSIQNGRSIHIEILPDMYGSEVAWLLKDSNGNLLGSGQNLSGSIVSYNDFCLQPGQCYDFIITDAGANGICCGSGNGMYRIRDDVGIIASGGQFGARDSVHFCIANVPPQVSIQIPSMQICQGNGMFFNAQAVNGPVAVNWIFNGGIPTTSTQISQNVIFQTPGTYMVYLIGNSAVGADTDSVMITVFPRPQLTMSSTPNIIPGSPNGSASVSLTGGTPPFTYSWSNGGTTPSISQLPAGTYIVTVTDANNCATQGLAIVSTQTGIHQINQLTFEVFPNPSAGDFLIRMPNTIQGNCSWILFDILGTKIHEGSFNTHADGQDVSLEISTLLPEGIYLLRVEADGKTGFAKVRIAL